MTSIVTFYRFVAIDDPERLREHIDEIARTRGVVGTVLLAHEGINATLAHPQRRPLEETLATLRKDSRLGDIIARWSRGADGNPVFHRLKVRVRPEIVTLDGPLEATAPRGTHVDADTWNRLLEDPQVTVIDTRNDYEIESGTFPGARAPGIRHFRDFPEFVADLSPVDHPRVAMFCTGGIRCEKAGALMTAKGFEVYQLDGGILRYLETVGRDENAWQGECFVFDQRVTLTADLQQGDYVQCHACRRPVSEAGRQSPDYRPGVSCPKCANETSTVQRSRYAERARQEARARARGGRHVGARQEGLRDVDVNEVSS